MCFISQVFRCELNGLSAPIGEVAHERMHVLLICWLNWVLPHHQSSNIYVSCITYNYNVKTIDLCWRNIPGRFHILTTQALDSAGQIGTTWCTWFQLTDRSSSDRSHWRDLSENWSKDDIKSINGCFLCTDWSIFLTGTSSLDEAADVVSSSVIFNVCRVRHQLQDGQSTPTTSLGIYHRSKTIWKGSNLPSGREIRRDYRQLSMKTMLQGQAGEQFHREQRQAVLEGDPDDHQVQTTE